MDMSIKGYSEGRPYTQKQVQEFIILVALTMAELIERIEDSDVSWKDDELYKLKYLMYGDSE